MKLSRNRAFLLIELIVVVAVMAIITATIIPSISGSREAATEQRAIAVAEALNLAQTRYRLENGTSAWAGDNATKYGLIQGYLEYGEGYAAFVAKYAPYTFTFQDLDGNGHMQKVTIANASGPVNY